MAGVLFNLHDAGYMVQYIVPRSHIAALQQNYLAVKRLSNMRHRFVLVGVVCFCFLVLLLLFVYERKTQNLPMF